MKNKNLIKNSGHKLPGYFLPALTTESNNITDKQVQCSFSLGIKIY